MGDEDIEAAAIPEAAVTINYDCGSADAAAKMSAGGVWPLGGTEMRCLAAYDGKLFAATGYWKDKPVPGDVQSPGPCILRLDSGNGVFKIEHSFRSMDTAVCLLYSAWFKSAKATVFIASTWNSRHCDLYVRNYPSASWHFAQSLAEQPDGGPSMQVRSAITYTDPMTGVTRLYLGQQPRGIFSLEYDAKARGGLGQARLEFDTSDVPLIPAASNARAMSFAELGGELYATVLNRLYRRTNGVNPCWHCVHVDGDIGTSESGWRGLTVLGQSAASPGYFFVAREGSKAALLKLNPPAAEGGAWTQAVVYDMVKELSAAWTRLYGGEVKAGYGIAAYNDMVWFQPPGATHWSLFVGFESQVTKYPANFPVVVDPTGEVSSKHAAIASYLVWNFARDGKWVLNQLPPVTSQPMVSCRCGLPAPFKDGTRFYIGGRDANKIEAHNSAWLVSVPMARLIEGAVA